MIIKRISRPHQYDHAPFASICKVKASDNDKCIIYIQLSFNEDNPRWEEFGAMPAYYTNVHMHKELQKILKG